MQAFKELVNTRDDVKNIQSISLLSVLSPLALDPNKITLLIEYFLHHLSYSQVL